MSKQQHLLVVHVDEEEEDETLELLEDLELLEELEIILLDELLGCI